jgi:hypothetical protein
MHVKEEKKINEKDDKKEGDGKKSRHLGQQ